MFDDIELTLMKSPNVVWHDGYITREDRNNAYGHKSGIIWFTGLSASGKSTVAHLLEKMLFEEGIKVYVFDGDNIRHGLNADLGFSPEDRKENLRRIAEVAKLFVDAGVIVLASFISPLEKDRELIKSRFQKDEFIEVYVKCPVEVCEARDPKGMYKKAKAGIIKGYTGVDAPYEEPISPALIVETDKLTPEESAKIVYDKLKARGWI